MANAVKISKHSDTKLKVILNKETIYFFDKSSSEVYATSSQISLKDNSRVLSFNSTDVIVPVGNTTLEIVTNIQKVIES